MALHEWRDPVTGERKWLTDGEYGAARAADAKATFAVLFGGVPGLLLGLLLAVKTDTHMGVCLAVGFGAVAVGGFLAYRYPQLMMMLTVGLVGFIALDCRAMQKRGEEEAASQALAREDARRLGFDVEKAKGRGYTEAYRQAVQGTPVRSKQTGQPGVITGFEFTGTAAKYTVRFGSEPESQVGSSEIQLP